MPATVKAAFDSGMILKKNSGLRQEAISLPASIPAGKIP
jgi:hypothetical protein